MAPFHIIGILTTLAALFGYLNYRFFRLPVMVGLMLQSLLLSLLLLVAGGLPGVDVGAIVRSFVRGIDFNEILMGGILSFLLFAGAFFTDPAELHEVRGDIAILSLAGVVISTVVVGTGMYWLAGIGGLRVPLPYCLVFGALISPTDPVAVLAILVRERIPRQVRARITGEALFNDGIGIVLFMTLVGLTSGEAGGFGAMAGHFLREAVGGLLFGFLLGGTGILLLKTVDDYPLEILITLALVTGGYSLATTLGVSGPLAMVVAGLLLGSHGRRVAMSARTRENLDRFWELVEEMLNSVLFTLIGLEVFALSEEITLREVGIAFAVVVLVLAARFVSVGVLFDCFLGRRGCRLKALPVIAWCGIRGGISIAMAISLPASPYRSFLLVATYVVAVFSIIVQGMTVRQVLKGAFPWKGGRLS